MATKNAHQHGKVTYTGRALRMDATEAMGRDIVRAIIELTTNSDDAYERVKARAGKIWIGVDHSYKGATWNLVVRDRAGGMRLKEQIDKLTHIGTRSSGFEHGAAVRGNRGRGAKDLIAFGTVTFESIKDRRYSWLRLKPSGDWEGDERDATMTDRQRLHLPRGDGMEVTVHVEREFRCPRHERLTEAISLDFQLRDILADPAREVLLAKLNAPEHPPTRLRYEVDPAAVEPLLDDWIEVSGYEAAGRIRLRVSKLPERCDATSTDRARPCGLLIAGRRALYDNTLMRFEGLPHAGWLAGRVDCSYIDVLAREYDDRDERSQRQTVENPIQIISRRRHGLAPDHPFTQALYAELEASVAPLVERLEDESRAHSRELESTEARQALDRLSREAARLLAEALREIDEQDERGPEPGPLAPMRLIPERLNVELGGVKTMSVVCDRRGLQEGDEVLLACDPRGVVELVDGSLIPLGPHRRREDGFSAQVRLKALTEAETIITASVNGRSEAALVRVVPTIEEPEPNPPATLTFERPRVRVGFHKRKTIELYAPTELIGTHGDTVTLRSSDPGVVLRRQHYVFQEDEQLGFCIARISMEGRALGAKGVLTAVLGDVRAECRVAVVERDDGLPDLRIEYSDEEPGAFRAYFDPPDPGPDGSQALKILILHPAVRPVLRDDLTGEQTPQWQTLLVEIITDAMVRRLITRRYPVSQDVDVQTLYREHAYWQTRLLPRLMRRGLTIRAHMTSV